jgi:capsule polysaccharide export protein KpsC/LpsZ
LFPVNILNVRGGYLISLVNKQAIICWGNLGYPADIHYGCVVRAYANSVIYDNAITNLNAFVIPWPHSGRKRVVVSQLESESTCEYCDTTIAVAVEID